MQEKARVLDAGAMARAIARISYEILERNRGAQDLCLIGIKARGDILARRVAQKIAEVEGVKVPVGVLDITPYRDDRTVQEKGEDSSDIPFSVTGKRVVLMDDVLYTGRTVRAAMDAVLSRGRPKNIQLAAFIDRGHRELPIRPDYVGKNLPTSSNEVVQVHIEERDGKDFVSICVKEESH